MQPIPAASVLQTVPHIMALLKAARMEFARIDATTVMMYYVEVCPAPALVSLARQFDVLGWRGWILAETEAAQRELVSRAIFLHSRAGTPGAIRAAILAVGFPGLVDVEIVEGVGLNYDGDFTYDGAQNYGGGFWANFGVILEVDGTFDDSSGSLARVTRLVEAWQNERSVLVFVRVEVVA